jgi:anti-anti-sigma factor
MLDQLLEKAARMPAGPVQVRLDDAVPIVEVTGDLDLGEVRAFDDALQRASRSSAKDVIVSLEKTDYFNSGAVRLIMRLANRLSDENRHLLLVAPRNRTPRRVLDIVYMTSDLLPFESVEEALAAVAG